MESKPVKKSLENEGVDRISDLPDPILDKIVSFLPTKNAVATSILSKRWKILSPFDILPIELDLDDSLLLHPEENESNNSPSVSFMDFVDKLLNVTLSNVPFVEFFSIICHRKNYGDAKIVSWVCAALRLNVRELSLDFTLRESYSLFVGLNGCTTLVRLELVLDSELCVPDDFSLPNLEFLHLSKLTLINEGEWFMTYLIEGCPALEDLCLSDCNLSDLDIFGIESPGLKNLRMENCFADNNCDFHLNLPNLEVLIFNDYVAWDYSARKFKSPLMAHINVGPSQKQLDESHNQFCYDEDDGSWQFDNAVARLVTACSNTKRLYLAGCAIVALCMTALKLPEFQNLTWLSLGHIPSDGWALLARLLQNAPNLERLCIEEGFMETEEGFENFQNSLPVSPMCLDMHMKRIEFEAFKGDGNEIKLVEYFLKNGDVLQKITIFCLRGDDSILMRLLRLPRRSKTCEIEFSWRDHM